MSVVLSLTSAAIIAGLSISSTTAMQLVMNMKNNAGEESGLIETVFIDGGLLKKTLEEHGACVKVLSDLEYQVEITGGVLRYIRKSESEPFFLALDKIPDPQALIDTLMEIEMEYGRNVQSYTYYHLKENLTDEMTVTSEEVLDDDSIMLTIRIED